MKKLIKTLMFMFVGTICVSNIYADDASVYAQEPNDPEAVFLLPGISGYWQMARLI